MILLCRLPQPADRRDARALQHAAAWELLKQALWEQRRLCLDSLEVGRGAHGKPYLPAHPQIHFSLTHCDGLAACALADRPVGIDAERVGRMSEGALMRFFSPEESAAVRGSKDPARAFCVLWTRMESLAKADGRGIAHTHGVSAAARYETRFLHGGFCLTVCWLDKIN